MEKYTIAVWWHENFDYEFEVEGLPLAMAKAREASLSGKRAYVLSKRDGKETCVGYYWYGGLETGDC